MADRERDLGGIGTGRRTFLRHLAAGGALVTTGTASATTETDAEAPPAPTNLQESGVDAGHRHVTWEWPGDPCESSLSHFVVTVDGSVDQRVAPGVNRAFVHTTRPSSYPPREGEVSLEGWTVGVAAVDEAGNESEPGQVELSSAAVVEPMAETDLTLSRSMVPVGETLSVSPTVTSGWGLQGDRYEEFEFRVGSTTPCAVAVTDAHLPDGVTGSVTVAEDGSEARLTGTGLDRAAGEGPFGTVELTASSPHGTVVWSAVTMRGPEGEGSAQGEGTELVAYDDGTARPAPPVPVEARDRRDTTIDVVWNGGVACETDVSHYEITLDGSRVRTVPAGVTATRIETDHRWYNTVGVRAVDEAGHASPTATVEAFTDASPNLEVAVDPERTAVERGQSVAVPVRVEILDPAGVPDEWASRRVAVELDPPCRAAITGVSYPDWLEGDESAAVQDDGRRAVLEPTGTRTSGADEDPDVDLTDTPTTVPARRSLVATLEVTGEQAGQVTVVPTLESVGGETHLEAATSWATLEMRDRRTDQLTPIGDEPPRDPDDDGDYEDVTGDGNVDFNDLVAHYQHWDHPAMTRHVDAYDYTGDGELDFADLVALYGEL